MPKKKRQKVITEPVCIKGQLFIDDRGEVGCVNNFDMHQIRRFYTVVNHKAGFVRAWHAHKKESKYVTVTSGSAIIAAVKIDNWSMPSRDLDIHRFVLSAATPAVIFIPKGYANGFKTLTIDTKLMFFSIATLEQSRNDDFRYDAYYWNPWEIVER
ncbi:MAG: dTDP-4-dehydrorhamnose 3,5-epimerase family protein [Planctomycetota bacterium]|jgi:dTDP-4-dehydrorhamnose 3,5-epimerase